MSVDVDDGIRKNPAGYSRTESDGRDFDRVIGEGTSSEDNNPHVILEEYKNAITNHATQQT